jgi:hypothetical protein
MKNFTELYCSIIRQNLANSLKFSATGLWRKKTALAKPSKTSLFQNRFSILVCWLSLTIFSPVVPANIFDDLEDSPFSEEMKYGFALWYTFTDFSRLKTKAAAKSLSAQIPSAIYHGAYIKDTDNSAYATDLGESLFVGMTHTMWRNYVPTRNERVVLNTYGSTTYVSPFGELDTQLVVYRVDTSGGASGYKSLQAVAASDNKRVIGGFGLGSLVQFDAQKGQTYAIQVGSRPGGGFVVLTGFSFPVSGGLSVQPLNIEGLPGGYDPTRLSGYGSATYIIHNSTAKTLQVKASTTLGSGIDLPKPFTLAAGAATVKTVRLNTGFDKVTLRTDSGEVAFSGFVGNKLDARSVVPTLLPIATFNPSELGTLEVTSTAQVLAGGTGEAFYWPMKVKNTGKFTAIGCYVRANQTRSEVAWASYDPLTQKAIGEPNAPFDLPVGKTKDVLAAIRFFRDRLADPLYASPAVEIQCANARRPNIGEIDLSSSVDFTNTVTKYPKLTLVKTVPESGIFNVSAPGKTFTATFRNNSAETANVMAVVKVPFESETNKAYTASVCPATTSNAACLQATTTSLPISVAANKDITLKVAVRQPTGTPPFAPSYGLSLLLMHDYNFSGTFGPGTLPAYIPVGGITKALRKK